MYFNYKLKELFPIFYSRLSWKNFQFENGNYQKNKNKIYKISNVYWIGREFNLIHVMFSGIFRGKIIIIVINFITDACQQKILASEKALKLSGGYAFEIVLLELCRSNLIAAAIW